MNKQTLIISEMFYSIQGEGPTAGKPAVFLRLAGCNLRCPGFSYKDPQTGEHLGCDTALVWQSGKQQAINEIIQYWQMQGWIDALNQGAHLVITGGEPTIHQTQLIQFFNLLDRVCAKKPYIEIETNATFLLKPEFIFRLNQINASPKLKHSGEDFAKRYKPGVLMQLVNTPKTKFKFVLANQSDMQEILENYIDKFAINSNRIWLMPEGGTRDAINEKSNWIVELCKQHQMHYSPRLQISIWGEVTGV